MPRDMTTAWSVSEARSGHSCSRPGRTGEAMNSGARSATVRRGTASGLATGPGRFLWGGSDDLPRRFQRRYVHGVRGAPRLPGMSGDSDMGRTPGPRAPGGSTLESLATG